MTMLKELTWLSLAGAVGTLARYGLSIAVQRACGSVFPWGTLTVNLLGCLLFGIVSGLMEDQAFATTQMRIVILVGFMGAFTTFSTYAFETGEYLRQSRWLLAAANFLSQNLLGLFALAVGMVVGRHVR